MREGLVSEEYLAVVQGVLISYDVFLAFVWVFRVSNVVEVSEGLWILFDVKAFCPLRGHYFWLSVVHVNKFRFSNGSIAVHVHKRFFSGAVSSQMVLSWLNVRVADTV